MSYREILRVADTWRAGFAEAFPSEPWPGLRAAQLRLRSLCTARDHIDPHISHGHGEGGGATMPQPRTNTTGGDPRFSDTLRRANQQIQGDDDASAAVAEVLSNNDLDGASMASAVAELIPDGDLSRVEFQRACEREAYYRGPNWGDAGLVASLREFIKPAATTSDEDTAVGGGATARPRRSKRAHTDGNGGDQPA